MGIDRRFLTAPYQPPRERRCARCDGVIDILDAACCSACIAAAHRAIRDNPGQVITPMMIDAARRGD